MMFMQVLTEHDPVGQNAVFRCIRCIRIVQPTITRLLFREDPPIPSRTPGPPAIFLLHPMLLDDGQERILGRRLVQSDVRANVRLETLKHFKQTAQIGFPDTFDSDPRARISGPLSRREAAFLQVLDGLIHGRGLQMDLVCSEAGFEGSWRPDSCILVNIQSST